MDVNDVIAPKRSSLQASLIEVNMFLKMNKHLLCSNVFEVIKLDLQWESFIPKRPTMSEYDTNDEDKDDTEADKEYEAWCLYFMTTLDYSFYWNYFFS